MATHTSPETRLPLTRWLIRGGSAGMIGGMAMAMYAMIASLTYQHHGFFTPLYHISSLTGSPASMMTSMMQAASGHNFWFAPGAALVGLIIHMMTGAAYGMMFAVAARYLPRASYVIVGAGYGLMVFVVSSFILLPIAASVSGAGDPIRRMASMVGYSTFAVEHIVETIHSNWDEAADLARLSRSEKDALFGSAILNPYASYGYNSGPSSRTTATRPN